MWKKKLQQLVLIIALFVSWVSAGHAQNLRKPIRLMREGQYSRAKELLQEMVGLSEEIAGPTYLLALCYLKQAKPAEDSALVLLRTSRQLISLVPEPKKTELKDRYQITKSVIDSVFFSLDDQAWQEAKRAASIAALQTYQQVWEDGDHLDEARQWVDSLAWQPVAVLRTEANITQFLSDWPQHAKRQQVLFWLDSLREAEAVKNQNGQALIELLKRHPDWVGHQRYLQSVAEEAWHTQSEPLAVEAAGLARTDSLKAVLWVMAFHFSGKYPDADDFIARYPQVWSRSLLKAYAEPIIRLASEGQVVYLGLNGQVRRREAAPLAVDSICMIESPLSVASGQIFSRLPGWRFPQKNIKAISPLAGTQVPKGWYYEYSDSAGNKGIIDALGRQYLFGSFEKLYHWKSGDAPGMFIAVEKTSETVQFQSTYDSLLRLKGDSLYYSEVIRDSLFLTNDGQDSLWVVTSDNWSQWLAKSATARPTSIRAWVKGKPWQLGQSLSGGAAIQRFVLTKEKNQTISLQDVSGKVWAEGLLSVAPLGNSRFLALQSKKGFGVFDGQKGRLLEPKYSLVPQPLEGIDSLWICAEETTQGKKFQLRTMTGRQLFKESYRAIMPWNTNNVLAETDSGFVFLSLISGAPAGMAFRHPVVKPMGNGLKLMTLSQKGKRLLISSLSGTLINSQSQELHLVKYRGKLLCIGIDTLANGGRFVTIYDHRGQVIGSGPI